LDGNTFVAGGVRAGDNARLTATRNSFLGCDVGIFSSNPLGKPPSVISGNTFAACRRGLELLDSSGGTAATGNAFLRNREIGLHVAASFASDAARITGNQFVGNGGDGLAGTGPAGIVVGGNLAVANGGHGINVGPLVRNGARVGAPTDGGRNV